MRIIIVFLLLVIFSLKTNAQDYGFINEVITPFEESSEVPIDSIFLNKEFIILGKDYINIDMLNEETIKIWWKSSYKKPPVELFLDNYNLRHLKNDILDSQKDSIIDFSKLEKHFYAVDNQFIKNNSEKNYLSISKPFYNCKKDWCFIIKSKYIPIADTHSGLVMHIYVKSNGKWILYNTINVG